MLGNLTGAARQFASDNASTLLTAGGVVGTVATAVLAGRASVKAHEIIKEKENEGQVLRKLEKAALVAPTFIPPVLTGGLTIAAIIWSNRISASKAAALAAAYGVSRDRLEEYQAKMTEKLTGHKKQAIDDEIAQDHVRKNPSNEVIILADGDVLCYDMLSGRYFRSTVEQIRKAVHVTNNQIENNQYSSLTEFYENIGLPSTSLSDSLGWSNFTQDMPLEVKLSTTLTADDKPCLAVDFNIMPVPDYARSY